MKRSSMVSVRAVIAAGAVVTLAFAALVVWRSSQAIRSASEDVRAEREFQFVTRPLSQPASAGFELISLPSVFVQAARFEDHLYIAGPAGLLEYTPEGPLLHQYAVGGSRITLCRKDFEGLLVRSWALIRPPRSISEDSPVGATYWLQSGEGVLA